MKTEEDAIAQYGVYETEGGASGYDFRSPDLEDWLTPNLRKHVLSLVAILRDQVTARNIEQRIEYQGMITPRTRDGSRLLTFCWLYYGASRPSSKYLFVRLKHSTFCHVDNLCMQVLGSPVEWLEGKVSSPVRIHPIEEKPELEIKVRLIALEAMMKSARVVIPHLHDYRRERIVHRLIALPPHFLFDRLLLGHSLRAWPEDEGTSLVIDGPFKGRGVLSLFEYKSGTIVEIGQCLNDSSCGFSQERILKLCWELYRGKDSREAALQEIKPRLNVEMWRHIRRMVHLLPIGWMRFKNRKII